ncbi:MAG: aldehyde dehydrogenase family protein [Pyrinomonadaceae bacterium]
MSMLHGKSIVAGEVTNEQTDSFRSFNPATGGELEVEFYEATPTQIDAALQAAQSAFHIYRKKTAAEIADFLAAIAGEIEALGDALIEQTSEETALPAERLKGERASHRQPTAYVR